jgi:ketosteroid isomerase-like protein
MSFPKTLYELPRKLLGFHAMLAFRPRPSRAALEERVAVLEAESQIRNLLNRYAYGYDGDDLDHLKLIYSDDCLLVNRHGTFVGPGAIRANYQRGVNARAVSFHHLSNVEISLEPSNAEAWVTAYIYNLTVKDGTGGGAMASCVFHVKRNAAGWLVHECRVVVTHQHDFLPRAARESNKKPVPTRPETVAELIDE